MSAINLSGKIAWVTGSSRGIGRAIALQLAISGADVILAGRDENALKSTQQEIFSITKKLPIILTYDVSSYEQIKQAFTSFNKNFKKLDIMVNNAGVLESALLPMLTASQLHKMLQINCEATIYHMQFATRWMARQKSGSIINMSSIMGRFGDIGQTAYAASKAAIIGASLAAAKELAASNIRVNVVAPGFIDTDMARDISEEKLKERLSTIKLQRIGKPEEVAHTVTFLASDLSSYITGQIIGVDGGMIL
jgi:3-oxoacyl-[acyl-carrier protein] reductase